MDEDAGNIVFTVGHDGPPSRRDITLDYATADGDTNPYSDAMAGSDYTAISGELKLEAGEQSRTLTVPVLDDNIAEVDETFSLTLSNLRNAAFIGGVESITVVGTIEDDEPRISVSARSDSVTEGQPAVFDITRTGDTTESLTVTRLYFVGDYDRSVVDDQSPALVFPIGVSTISHEVPTVDDDLDEPDGEIRAHGFWREGLHYDFSNTYSVTVTILDNDLPLVDISGVPSVTEGTPARFTLARIGDLSGSLTVNVTTTTTGNLVSGTLPTTAVFPANQATLVLHIATEDDETVEVHGSVTMEIDESDDWRLDDTASYTVLVQDDDDVHPLVTLTTDQEVVDEGDEVVFTLTRDGVRVDEELTGLRGRPREELWQPYHFSL